jgi:hypothetical protein
MTRPHIQLIFITAVIGCNFYNCPRDKTFYFVSLFLLTAVYCCCLHLNYLSSCMAQAVNRWPFTRKHVFDPRSVYVGFMLNKLALELVSFRVLLFSLVSIIPLIPPMLLTHSFIHSFIHSFMHSSPALYKLSN